MKKCLLFLMLFALVSTEMLAASTNFASKRAGATVAIEKPLKTLSVGEKLEFEVSWMGVMVGIGALEVKEKVRIHGREAFHVIAVARTNDFLSKIYPIHDEVHSFIDAERLCSLEFRKTLREGRYRADETVIYDYEKGKAFHESQKDQSKKELPIGPFVHDLLSVFYWFRLQPVEVGESLHAVVNSRQKDWNVELAVLSQQTKELKGGRVIQTIKAEPKTRLKGVLDKRGRAWVYFTTDSRRLPVWIQIKTPFGPVNGVLKESTA
jgi:hypothetical protein